MEISNESNREWYERERNIYERLCDSVRSTLDSAITHADIPFLTITSRAKEISSFVEKIARKSYDNPQEQMTDLSGGRIICFIESDVYKICELIRSVFHVHEDKSKDKGDDLGKDRFGYRSVHFVCDLGERRLALAENEPFKKRVFEIQVRTVLQHAWAEIEHDRGYKFAGTLPKPFERRLHSQAAILEAVDREFDRLAHELDSYAHEVARKTSSGQLDTTINSTSVFEYIGLIIKKLDKVKIADRKRTPSFYDGVVAEMHELGIKTLADLDAYFNDDFLSKANTNVGVNSGIGLIRDALMYADLEGYFTKVTVKWGAYDDTLIHLLYPKYGKDFVDKIMESNGLEYSGGGLF